MTVDWYKAAQCAMRNKNKPLPEIAAAMEVEQPEAPVPEIHGKSITRWAGLNTNGIASLECDTGWGGRGDFDTTLLAIFEDRADAEERYSGVAQVTITLAEIGTIMSICLDCGEAWSHCDCTVTAAFNSDLIKPKECNGCETGIADGPSDLCPGCQAYREHQS